MRKYLTKLCNNIISGRFNYEKYRSTEGFPSKTYYGKKIETATVFDTYGGHKGFEVYVNISINGNYCEWEHTIRYDWIINKLTIDNKPWQDFINMLYLEENNIRHN